MITFDNSEQGQNSAGFNFTHTITSSPNRFLAVSILTNRDLDFCRYNGVDFQYQSVVTLASSQKLYMVGFLNPDSGANNITIGFAAISAMQKVVTSTSYYGVSQDMPLGSQVTNFAIGNSMADDISLLYSSSWTVEAQGNGVSSPITQDSSQTEREQLDGANVSMAAADKSFTVPGVQTLGFSSSPGNDLGHIIWELVDVNGFGAGNLLEIL